MNLRDNDSTEITLLRILKYRPSAEMTGKSFFHVLRTLRVSTVLFQLLQNTRKGGSQREILPPGLKLSELK